jgi:hypothetical protein
MSIDVERKALPFDGAKPVILCQGTAAGIMGCSLRALHGEFPVLDRSINRLFHKLQLLSRGSCKMHGPVEEGPGERTRSQAAGEASEARPERAIEVLAR